MIEEKSGFDFNQINECNNHCNSLLDCIEFTFGLDKCAFFKFGTRTYEADSTW